MLVEVSISLVIISIALLSILGTFTAILQSVFSVRDSEEAALVAIAEINDMESLNISDIPAHEEGERNGLVITRSAKFFNLKGNETTASGDKAYAELTVTVRRDGSGGRAFSMTRRISRNAYRNVGSIE